MASRRLVILAALGAVVAPRAGNAFAASTADWRQVSSSGAPGGRWDHTLSAHAGRKALVLAFGRDNAGTPLGDCWVADRSTGAWEPLEASGPSARFGHAVATDESSGLIYLYGGQFGDQFFSDLWALDLEAGRWELLSDGADGPSPRYGTSLVFDGEAGLFVSHGFTFEGRFDDTWRFDLNLGRWEDRSPAPDARPLRRCLHEAVWDGASSSMWLYGGCSSGFGPCPQGDVWSFDPVENSWREVTTTGPEGRSNPSLALDRGRDRLMLFGGLTTNGAAGDLWLGELRDGAITWESVEPSPDGPGARSSHDAVMSGGALYLFGGLGPDGALGDLWRLKLDS